MGKELGRVERYRSDVRDIDGHDGRRNGGGLDMSVGRGQDEDSNTTEPRCVACAF